LDSMLPRGRAANAAETVSEPPRRLLCINTTLGLHTPNLFPTAEGADYELTPYLAAIKDHRREFTIFSGLLTWVRQYLVLHTGNRVDAVLGAAVWEHLLKLPLRYFEHRATGVVAARLHGVENIREFVSGAAVSLVLDLPFLPIKGGDWKTMRKVYDTLWERKELQDSLAKWNASRFIQNLLPMYEYMGRGTPPKSVADFKGKRLRALGGMGDAARAIGAVPTTMPASETYPALQRGTVDAVGFPFSYTFAAFKLDEISDWYTTNLSLGSPNCFSAWAKDKYEKLPKEYKAILAEAVPGAYEALKADYAEKDKINLPKWAKGGKLKAVTFGEAELEQFRKVGGKPVWDAWIKENQDGLPAQELFDLVMKTAKEAKK